MRKESQVICPLFSSLLAVMMVLKLLVKKCWHHVQGDLAVMNISDLACLVGIDFGAKLLASLAKCFKDECQKEDNLSLRNLTLLLSYLGFTQGTGMRLRSDDPVTMKSFIVTIQNKVTELKAASGDSQGNMRSKRTEFMLETIFDIKNNKGRLKRIPYIIPASKSGFKRYLRGKSDMVSSVIENIDNVAKKIDRESSEAQKMLQLAAGQRMNTDARRAIFCIIMSREDYIDAFEMLLRLDLQGKQDREIIRVLVECCLQEKVFNKYYCILAAKLCNHDKNHSIAYRITTPNWNQYN